MTVNLFGHNASFETSIRRIAAAFGAEAVLTVQPTKEGNTVVLAMKQVTLPGRDELARRAENIETRWQLPARKWLRMMRPVAPAAAPTPTPPA
jgi:ribosome recycling factor